MPNASPFRLLFLLLGLALLACGKGHGRRQVHPAFYIWQTEYRPDKAALDYLNAIHCQALYLKVLDIGRDPGTGRIQPYSRLELADTAGLAGRTIIPCIFITNTVFQAITDEEIAGLAQRIARALREHPLYSRLGPGGEIQFDCDWTDGTREAFFRFLRQMRTALPPHTRLSATIRLHQYKYRDRTGVPPADRGMLMCYNTGNIDDPEESNSIFELAGARRYLDGAPRHYPLPLDVALPLFSWSLVYRDGALWKIIPGLRPPELRDTAFFKPEPVKNAINARPVWTVRRATLREGHYLRPGDLIRWESLAPAQLRDAAGLAARFDLAPDARAAFFHLDTALIRQFPAGYVCNVCEILTYE